MIGIIAGTFACIYFALFDGVINQNSWWLALIAIGLVVLNVFLYLDLKRRLVYIDGNIIGSVGIFKTIEYDIKDIKGFNQHEKGLNIIPHLPYTKIINITNYIGNYNELVLTLGGIIPDLDFIEQTEAFDELINDDRLGYNEIERIAKIDKLKKISKIINIVSIGASIIFIFFPKWYLYQFFIVSFIPIAVIFIFKYTNGLIRIEEVKNDVYPSMFFSLFLSVMAVFLRALLDINIYNYDNIWLNVIIITIVLLVIFYSLIQNVPTKSTKKIIVLVSIIFIFLYSYGNFILIDYLFDKSKPTIYHSKIIDKHISSGKTTTYYLTPSAWATQTESDNVSVSEDQYENINIGDSINIYLYKGFFNVQYFEIESQ